MRRHWHGCWGFHFVFPPPFGFRPFPGREEYLRMLEEYKRALEEELREVEREIERLRRE